VTDSLFKKLNSIDVNEHKEKKNGFDYLSWPYAVKALLSVCPDATWRSLEPTVLADGSMIVWTEITANGITRTAYLPVLSPRNQAIKNPDAQLVNKAMQRCLVKAIALLGLGLYIYAGEDLPSEDDEADRAAASKYVTQDYADSLRMLNGGDSIAFRQWVDDLGEERRNDCYGHAPNGEKVKYKQRFDAMSKQADQEVDRYASQIRKYVEAEDSLALAQLFDELADCGPWARSSVWGRLTDDEKHQSISLSKGV